jgi:hypothetical protein
MFETLVAGDTVPGATADATGQTYWSISNTQDVTTWATSSDGVDYTTQLQRSGLSYVGFMSVTLTTYQDPGQPAFTVSIDDVNGGTPMGQPCPIAQLHDDFSGASLDPQWARSSTSNGTITQAGGQLTLATDADVGTRVSLIASTFYDLRDGTLTLEIPQMIDPMDPNVELDVTLTNVDAAEAAFSQLGGTLSFRTGSGQSIGNTMYEPDEDRWLRLRVDNGSIYWDVSSDNTMYTNVAQSNDVDGLDRMDVAVAVSGINAAAASAIIDNVNVSP